jgi:hypothetical protein
MRYAYRIESMAHFFVRRESKTPYFNSKAMRGGFYGLA